MPMRGKDSPLNGPLLLETAKEKPFTLGTGNSKARMKKKLLDRLGPVPERCGLQGVAGSVDVANYYDLVKGSVSEIHAYGYTLAIAPLIQAIESVIPANERYELIFEEQSALETYRDKKLRFYSRIMDRDPRMKDGTRKKQLVSWRTMSKGQFRLFEPADYLCSCLAHHAADPNSRRSVWTRPIMESGNVRIRHLTTEFTRHLFSISPSLRLPDRGELQRMKRAIRSGEYDPWEEFFNDPENQ
jgi:hypothetical protein